MKAKMLKLAGVKSEAEFYKLYPTEESFMKLHGHKLMNKYGPGGATTDGCPPGYQKHSLLGCVPIPGFQPIQKEQAQLKTSKTAIPTDTNYGKKVDPYERIIAKETAAKQAEKNKDLAKRAAVSAGIAGAIVTGGMAAPYIAPALQAPLLGSVGAEYGLGALTAGNALSAGFATDAIVNRLPQIPGQIKRGEYANAAENVLTGGLDLLGANMLSPLYKPVANLVGDIPKHLKNSFKKGANAIENIYKEGVAGSIDASALHSNPAANAITDVHPNDPIYNDLVLDLEDDMALKGYAGDYNAPLNDAQYKRWKRQIFGDRTTGVLSLDDLKNAHKESIDYFKNATGAGGKEHGLYIRSKFADKIPNFNSIKFDDLGNRIYESSDKHQLALSQNYLKKVTDEKLMSEIGYDITKMTPQQRHLMESYAHGYDNLINAALRNPGQNKVSQFYQGHANTLNEGILKNKFKNPTTVRRGIQSDYSVDLLHPETFEPLGQKKMRSELSKGDVFKDNSFLSTSSNPESQWGTRQLSETIEIPGGGIQSVAIPDAATMANYRGEREAILPKGLIRQVIDDELGKSIFSTKFRTKILNPYSLSAIIGGKMALNNANSGNEEPLPQQAYGGPLVDYYAGKMNHGEMFKDGGLAKAQRGISFFPEQDPEMMYADRFNTALNEEELSQFNDWVAKESERRGRNILMDRGAYDVQGFWKSGDYKKMDQDNHGTDTWKKPNHPTFSNQSKYHGIDGFYGGNWNPDGGYQPSKQTASLYGPSYYAKMFAEEPNRPEHLDASRFKSGANSPSPLYYKEGGSVRQKAIYPSGTRQPLSLNAVMSQNRMDRDNNSYSGGISKFADGGEGPGPKTLFPTYTEKPTRRDSLDLLNRALQIKDHYKNKGYIQFDNEFDRLSHVMSGLKKADENSILKNKALSEQAKKIALKKLKNSYTKMIGEKPNKKENTNDYLEKLKDARDRYKNSGGPRNYIDEKGNKVLVSKEALPYNKYYSEVNPNQFEQRDLSFGYLDLTAPKPLYDKRITPQNLLLYTAPGQIATDNVEIYGYDPLAVSPFDILDPQQQKERVEKYGISGTPFTNIEEAKSFLNNQPIVSTPTVSQPITTETTSNKQSVQQNPSTVAWNVEYFDPTLKKTTTKTFATDKEAEDFYNNPANQASRKYSNVSSVGRFNNGGQANRFYYNKGYGVPQFYGGGGYQAPPPQTPNWSQMTVGNPNANPMQQPMNYGSIQVGNPQFSQPGNPQSLQPGWSYNRNNPNGNTQRASDGKNETFGKVMAGLGMVGMVAGAIGGLGKKQTPCGEGTIWDEKTKKCIAKNTSGGNQSNQQQPFQQPIQQDNFQLGKSLGQAMNNDQGIAWNYNPNIQSTQIQNPTSAPSDGPSLNTDAGAASSMASSSSGGDGGSSGSGSGSARYGGDIFRSESKSRKYSKFANGGDISIPQLPTKNSPLLQFYYNNI
jgi:hypothetical protein